jgi:hypothetical protein
MNVLKRFRPSPGLVIACLALLLALGGTSYAAIQALPRNSVTSVQVKDRSLLARDFKAGQIPRGAAGPAGPAGAAGPAGPAGPSGAAKAYARVLAGGDVDDPRARGIADAAVSHPSAGVYCIDVEGGAVNAIATLDTAGSSGEISVGVLLNACPSGKEVEVHTYNSAGTASDLPFMVLVN